MILLQSWKDRFYSAGGSECLRYITNLPRDINLFPDLRQHFCASGRVCKSSFEFTVKWSSVRKLKQFQTKASINLGTFPSPVHTDQLRSVKQNLMLPYQSDKCLSFQFWLYFQFSMQTWLTPGNKLPSIQNSDIHQNNLEILCIHQLTSQSVKDFECIPE